MITIKEQKRLRIKHRVRNKISGTAARPRMSVFRSNKQIYVQIIDDIAAKTLVSASSLGMEKMPEWAKLLLKKPWRLESLLSFLTEMAICTMDVSRRSQMELVMADLNFKRLWQTE